MNASRLLVVVSAFAVLSCQTAAPNRSSHPLEGNWEMVSSRLTRADGTSTSAASPDVRSLKVIGPSRFVFITSRADGTFLRAAGGRYTIEGNRYTEHIDQTSGTPPLNQSYTFEWRVEGDTWSHSGTVNGMQLQEVWRRVE
jgi:hypothetical protein